MHQDAVRWGGGSEEGEEGGKEGGEEVLFFHVQNVWEGEGGVSGLESRSQNFARLGADGHKVG